jgi:hypothetical protein
MANRRDRQARRQRHLLLIITDAHLLKINSNLMNNVRRKRCPKARGKKLTKQSGFAPVLVGPANAAFGAA